MIKIQTLFSCSALQKTPTVPTSFSYSCFPAHSFSESSFIANATATSSLSLETFIHKFLVKLRISLKLSSDSLVRRVKPHETSAQRFPPQHSSRHLQLFQFRMFYHLLPTEHSVVEEPLQIHLPQTLKKLVRPNISYRA